jgi:hypothetical protein
VISLKRDVAFLVAVALAHTLAGQVPGMSQHELLRLIYEEVRDGLTLYDLAVDRRATPLQPSGN